MDHNHFMVVCEGNCLQPLRNALIDELACPLPPRGINILRGRLSAGFVNDFAKANRSVSRPVGIAGRVDLEITFPPGCKVHDGTRILGSLAMVSR